jgi:hypothetical protein
MLTSKSETGLVTSARASTERLRRSTAGVRWMRGEPEIHFPANPHAIDGDRAIAGRVLRTLTIDGPPVG